MRKMDKLTFFFILQIRQMDDDIFINQSKYIKDLLKGLGMKNIKFGATSMCTPLKLDDDIDRKPTDVKGHKGMIGPLSYLTTSKLDIIFSVYPCARFQASPK